MTLFLVMSCGSGGNSVNNIQNNDAVINLSASLDEQLITRYTTLSWETDNVNSCTASGDWSGNKPLNGSSKTHTGLFTNINKTSCNFFFCHF